MVSEMLLACCWHLMTMLYITSCQGAAGNYQPYVAATFLMYPDGMAASLGDDSSTLLYVYIVFFAKSISILLDIWIFNGIYLLCIVT